MSEQFIQVDVAYATPAQQWVIPVKLPAGATLQDALDASGIFQKVEGLKPEGLTFGVFGKAERNPKERVLQSGERVEIYRPLIADPKEARKKRAAKADEAGE